MKDTERICQDIEATKQRIGWKTEALKRHLSPTQACEPLAHVKESLQGGGLKILESFRENPVPLTLMGLGLGWLIVRDATAGRRAAAVACEPETGSAEGPGLGESVKEGMQGAADKVKDAAAGAAEKAKEAVRSAGEKVAQGAAKAKGAAVRGARKASDWFTTTLEENPLVLAVVSLGLGIVAGLSIPVTRAEAETAGRLGEKVAGEVLEKGAETIEAATEKAAEKAESTEAGEAPAQAGPAPEGEHHS